MMKHLTFRIISLLFILNLGTGYLHAQVTDPYPPGPVPDRIILTWEGDPAVSQSVTWRTNSLIDTAYAEIALADPSPDFVHEAKTYIAKTTTFQSDNNLSKYHTVTFTGLQPNTLYAYRVGRKDYWSEWFQFRTAYDTQAPYTFMYFGDAQNDIKSLWSRAIREAYSTMPKVDFMLHAGDLVNRCTRDAEWGEWFYAGGWLYGMIPSIATPGNHEYYRNEYDEAMLAPHWRPTFAFPDHGPKGYEEAVYVIDYQGTRFVSFDSRAALKGPEFMEVQVQWLDSVLANNPNIWTVVTLHHPLYSSKAGRDNPGLRENLKPLFDKYKVDIVLQGHDHTYSRGRNLQVGSRTVASEGPVYVVSVSGPKMYDLGLEEWVDRAASNTQLFQLITIKPDTLIYKAYTVTGELYDAFDLVKVPDAPNQLIERTPEGVEERLELPKRYQEGATEDEINAYNERFKAYKARKAQEK